MKSEEGNDSLDTIIRQAIGKEPFLSFSRAGESPVQWIQLLHALDQQGIKFDSIKLQWRGSFWNVIILIANSNLWSTGVAYYALWM